MTIKYAERTEVRFTPETQDNILSAFACPSCYTHLLKMEEEYFIHSFAGRKDAEYDCGGCGEGAVFDDYITTVEPASAHLVEDASVETEYWYHATTIRDWMNTVLNYNDMEEGEIPFVHVGTEAAALDRAKMQYFRNHIYNVFLFKVALKDTVSVSPIIHKDTNWWPAVADEESFDDYQGDAIRYINRYEMPGSISLLVDPSQLVVVDEMLLFPDMVKS